ncbi:MAG: phage major capsid protein [Acidobacteriota bacterium]|nr:phage major capsid protein [Acidobacteriota bacterium]
MAAYWQRLTQQIADVKSEATSIITAAETGNREFTENERTQLTELKTKRESLEADLALAMDARDHEIATTRVVVDANRQEAEKEETKKEGMPTPFASLGEQMRAIAASQISIESGGRADGRLLEINAALGANEAVPSEGGFLVQTDFQPGILQRIWETGQLFRKTDNTTVGPNSNGLKINAIDETSRATGSRWGGVRGYWLAEAATKTSSKPTFRQMELTLNKLAAVFYATDELLQDTQALEQEVAKSFMGELAFLVDDALIRGTGSGMPLGILNSTGTLEVAAVGGQDADTIIAENVWDMFFRMHPSSVARGEWYVNYGVMPQLQQLSAVVGVGGVPLFLPPGGMSASPYGTLLGRPINVIEHASALGDVGDIIFADWNAYKTISKGGVQTASSIHVAFLTDETAFRWVLRVDGQPKFNTVLTPYLGTETLANFITLAAR